MKKLIFLFILAMAMAGIALADSPAHPPGVLTLEAALFGYGVDGCAVTPDTVLAAAVMAEQSSLLADLALYNDLAGQPQRRGAVPVTDTGQVAYKLRL